MGEMYGHKWTSSHGEVPTPLWCGLISSLTDAEIRTGLAMCAKRGDEWPPSLPGFRGLATNAPEALGLPDADTAWAEASQIARRWKRPDECSHPGVWHALGEIVHFHALDEEVLEKRFRRNYEQVCRMVAAGEPLSAIPQPLPRPQDVQSRIETPPHVRDQALAKLEGMFGKRRAAQ